MLMKRAGIIGVFIAVVLLGPSAPAQEITPRKIFEKVKNAYASLETYQAEGTVTADLNSPGMKAKLEISFSIRLRKPNLYLISWTQSMGMPGMSQSGAVWSNGTQPYLYSANSYSKKTSDKMALAAATGISGGAAFTIPALFLPAMQDEANWLSRFKDPKVETIEKVGDEECYVVSGATAGSKKEAFWISKSRYLILKYARSLEGPEGGRTIPKLTDKQLDEAIRASGKQVTPESKKAMRAIPDLSKEMMARIPMTGSSTEVHTHISFPAISKQDATFTPPAGAVLKGSFLDEMPVKPAKP